jgi:hypothetical protein
MVVAVKTKPGDATVPSKPVVIMARPGAPIVRVDLDNSQAGRLAMGQQASIQLGTGTSSARADGVVKSVTPATQDGSVGASASLDVTWVAGQVPRFGTQVQVTVSLGGKQDVLVVPINAIRQAGGRTSVEVQDGTIRRLVSVQVGITTADRAEIVSGLTEGQVVLVAASG